MPHLPSRRVFWKETNAVQRLLCLSRWKVLNKGPIKRERWGAVGGGGGRCEDALSPNYLGRVDHSNKMDHLKNLGGCLENGTKLEAAALRIHPVFKCFLCLSLFGSVFFLCISSCVITESGIRSC